MALTFRDEQSADLTPEQVDENFRTLLEMIENLIDEFPGPVQMTGSILQSGFTVQFALSDATFTDPVTLPVLALNNRGEWVESTAYFVNDLVRIRGAGWYLVTEDHTSATAFDPDDDEYQFFMVDNTPSLPLEITTDTLEITRSAHLNRFLRCTHADGCAITIADDDWEDGDEITIRSKSAEPITIAGASGVDVETPDGFDAAISRRGGTVAMKYNADEATFELMGLLDVTSV